MLRFEAESLAKFDSIVAVSERDADMFATHKPRDRIFTIPTGVDLDFFSYHPPADFAKVVFCGSMDWLPNQDAIRYLLEEIWPLVMQAKPQARLTVIGQNPPGELLALCSQLNASVTFTGFVDDVRTHLSGAAATVIPMGIGGGTRLKVYEAVAVGNPVVSTSLGVEGLPIQPGAHFLEANTPERFAEELLVLLDNPAETKALAERARELVEQKYSYLRAAQEFEDICSVTADLPR